MNRCNTWDFNKITSACLARVGAKPEDSKIKEGISRWLEGNNSKELIVV